MSLLLTSIFFLSFLFVYRVLEKHAYFLIRHGEVMFSFHAPPIVLGTFSFLCVSSKDRVHTTTV